MTQRRPHTQAYSICTWRGFTRSEAAVRSNHHCLSIRLFPPPLMLPRERLFPLYLVGHGNVRGARLTTKLTAHVMLMTTVAKLLGNDKWWTCLVCGEKLESVCHFLARLSVGPRNVRYKGFKHLSEAVAALAHVAIFTAYGRCRVLRPAHFNACNSCYIQADSLSINSLMWETGNSL